MKNVTIVGVGALGSHVAQFLRNHAKLKVIDFDRLEQKNVMSQFHAKASVGKPKVLGLQQTMQFLFATKIEAVPHRLVENNAKELLSRTDLVIDCLDNGASRRLVQGFVRAAGVPCLHGALAANGAFGRIIWDQNFLIDDESGTGATCEDGEHLPFIATVSALIASSAQEFLKNGRKVGYQVYPGGVTRI